MSIRAVRRLVGDRFSGNYYQWRDDPTTGRPFGGYAHHDIELEEIANTIKRELQRYEERLRTLPSVEPPPGYDKGVL